MKSNYSNLRDPSVERVNTGGREYLTLPVVTLKEMVYSYPEDGTKEFLPAESIRESVNAWEGVPLTARHPPANDDGQQTARTADSYTNEVIGRVHDPEIVDGTKLRVNAWVDVERARDIGGHAAKIVEMLENGEELATSPGYSTINDRMNAGSYEGESYDLEQGVVAPDHVAIFDPADYRARCTPEDGCAAPRLHAIVDDVDETDPTMQDFNDPPEIDDSDRRRLGSVILNALGIGSDEPPECGDDCDCTDCSHDEDPDRVNADDGDDDGGNDDGPTDDHDSAGGTSDDDTMTDYSEKVQRLAEETDFTADQLDGMNDAQIETIESAAAPADDGGVDDDADAGADDDGDADSGVETTDSPDLDTDALVDNVVDAVEERLVTNYHLDKHAEDVEEVRQKKEEIVCNAHDLSEDAVAEMPDDVLDEMYEKAGSGQTERQRTNYGAVPGDMNRSPSVPEDEVDDYPAGTRREWNERQSGGD